ncbi:glutamine synthetase family protein [Mucilaginibacter sp. RS28]|uniref:Glutamine synthetase family protein n=1 Tax=Mucilaginibacter straminoryzae TaxID=2932774 RepID=A0A9X1X4V6_9SPHI|nr:glutamine synthetase family protein [Mucilaginibacter straminoryzae]MCJ8209638.1 glutamine synthetase family protein [Mucilaginibacter straminoryzae]
MTKKQILDYLDEHHIQHIKFAFADIDGVLRGKVIHRRKLESGLEDGYGFCDVVFGWDSSDAPYDHVDVTGWHTGYPDKPCRIDLSTFRTIPWQDNIPFFLADFSGAGNETVPCPRTLLKRIVNECHELGFHPEFAQEFEWFNFRETPQSLADKQYINPQPLTPGMFGYSILRPSQQSDFYYDLIKSLTEFDIPVEGLHTETGPGVYEAAIFHDEALRAADKAVLFKTAVKEIAGKHGIMASFMAKWTETLPGCSGHVHQSLWDAGKKQNLFFDSQDELHMSELIKHYIAGQLYCLPHLVPMYAPTINSYKRLVEGAWAPTTITWGIDNRTTALRIINHSEKHSRVETRIPGADTNPYLAIAAALASGLYGIKNKLALDIPPVSGNGYADKSNGSIPSNLRDAALAMQDSAIARELFGETFVSHFTKTRLWEWQQYSSHVTNWEIKRYFEII